MLSVWKNKAEGYAVGISGENSFEVNYAFLSFVGEGKLSDWECVPNNEAKDMVTEALNQM